MNNLVCLPHPTPPPTRKHKNQFDCLNLLAGELEETKNDKKQKYVQLNDQLKHKLHIMLRYVVQKHMHTPTGLVLHFKVYSYNC